MKKDRRIRSYKRLLTLYNRKLDGFKVIDITLITIKFILVFASLLFIIAAIRLRSLLLFMMIPIPVIITTIFFIIHIVSDNKKQAIKKIIEIIRVEIKTFTHYFPDYGTGENFISHDHRYASDLNLFGDNSLFHYINRTRTYTGQKKLANWLKERASLSDIHKRQKMIAELAGRFSFRIRLISISHEVSDLPEYFESIKALIGAVGSFLENTLKKYVLFCLPILMIISMGFIPLNRYVILLTSAIVFAQIIINRVFSKKTNAIYGHAIHLHKIIRCYTEILELLENTRFSNVHLKELQEELRYGQKTASFYLKKLSGILDIMQMKNNVLFFFIINSFFLFEIIMTYRLDRLSNLIAHKILPWIDTIGAFESLAALGGLYFRCPDWSFPRFVENEFHLEAEMISHPLIPEDERVSNSFKFEPEQKIMIITGPNMSGKSTFLRTVGISYVLANMGAPVSAGHFKASYPLDIYSSIQTNDSLKDRISFFYAELLKLKEIIDAIRENDTPIFFLIDEMLKGTNATDRTAGSIALVKQLLTHNTRGLIGTHNLEIANLEEAYKKEIANYHFDSIINKADITFTYQLTNGICTSFNSLVLMRNIGIEL